MYHHFEPKGAFQGLPPKSLGLALEWLRELEQDGCEQFVIESAEGIVGHAMLYPTSRGADSEVLMFLHQAYRSRGLGRELLLGALNHAGNEMRLERVWFRHNFNPIAFRLVESVGFRAHSTSLLWQWEFKLAPSERCPHCNGSVCPVHSHALPRCLMVDGRGKTTA